MESGPPIDAVDLLRHVELLAGRYGYDRLLLAAVVATFAQVIAMFLFRLVGAVLTVAVRVVTWSIGVVVVLRLLDGAVVPSVDGRALSRLLRYVLESTR